MAVGGRGSIPHGHIHISGGAIHKNPEVSTALTDSLVGLRTGPVVLEGHHRAIATLSLSDVLLGIAICKLGSSVFGGVDFHGFASGGSCWDAPGEEGLAGKGNNTVVGRPGGFRELIIDGVADMIKPANELTLAAGAMQEVHRVRREANPAIAATPHITLRVADVQGRR